MNNSTRNQAQKILIITLYQTHQDPEKATKHQQRAHDQHNDNQQRTKHKQQHKSNKQNKKQQEKKKSEPPRVLSATFCDLLQKIKGEK